MDILKLFLTYRHVCEDYCAMHHHSYYELVYHMSGSGSTTIESGNKHSFTKDAIVIYSAGIKHNQTMSQKGEDICLHFSVDDKNHDFKFGDCIVLPKLSNSYLENEILRLADIGDISLLKKQRQNSLNCRFTALVNDILDIDHKQTNEYEATTPAKVKLAYSYINEKFRTIQSVEDVASHVGISYDYLRHQFKQQYEVSMIQHLINSKLNYAKQLLLYTNLLQKQIAEECGFYNIRYFNTAFKKATGQTPGQFRKS